MARGPAVNHCRRRKGREKKTKTRREGEKEGHMRGKGKRERERERERKRDPFTQEEDIQMQSVSRNPHLPRHSIPAM